MEGWGSDSASTATVATQTFPPCYQSLLILSPPPSPQARAMATIPINSTSVVVDDTNPALVYSGAWVRFVLRISSLLESTSVFTVNVPAGELQMSSTPHLTVARRRVLPCYFVFKVCRLFCLSLPTLTRHMPIGTSIAVYGTIGTDTPSSAYTIDSSTPSVFVAGKPKEIAFKQMFYHSPTLTDGEHTLLITNLGSGEVWIDFLLFTLASPPLSSTSSSHPPSTTLLKPTLTSSTLQTLDLSSSPSLTDDGSGSSTGLSNGVSSNTRSSIPASAVAGGAIGALVLIVVLIFGLLHYRKRAKRLAGERILEKHNVLGGKITIPFSSFSNSDFIDPPESDEIDPGPPITPFTGAYTSGPHTAYGHGNSNVSTYPPVPAHSQSDYGYQNQDQPSTPIYHFSHHYSLRSGLSASSENIQNVGTGTANDGVNNRGSQYGSPQYGHANQINYPQDPRSTYNEAAHDPYASSDGLVVPGRRNSVESGESQLSLAYLSGDRVAMNPSSPLPDALRPSFQTIPQQSEKGRLVVYNPEVRQHQDGGVRLDLQQPHGSGSQQPRVVDIPPMYKPNY